MHPNTYLRAFWRAEIRPEIFVAMSFDKAHQPRFDDVIKPAIENGINLGNGQHLTAKRVDLSKTGDSILTDIMDGISHSLMVLADVSTVGRDSETGMAYRNGNVMYEVGLALASRQPSEVLLIRSDNDKFLFDVSTVPHKQIDFADTRQAIQILSRELVARLNEIQNINDARLAIAVATLTSQERDILSNLAQYGMGQVFWFKQEGFGAIAASPRLLDKQLIRTVRTTHDGKAAFQWTRLGKVLAMKLGDQLPVIEARDQPATSEVVEPDSFSEQQGPNRQA